MPGRLSHPDRSGSPPGQRPRAHLALRATPATPIASPGVAEAPCRRMAKKMTAILALLLKGSRWRNLIGGRGQARRRHECPHHQCFAESPQSGRFRSSRICPRRLGDFAQGIIQHRGVRQVLAAERRGDHRVRPRCRRRRAGHELLYMFLDLGRRVWTCLCFLPKSIMSRMLSWNSVSRLLLRLHGTSGCSFDVLRSLP